MNTSDIHQPYDILKDPVWQLVAHMLNCSSDQSYSAVSALQPNVQTSTVSFCTGKSILCCKSQIVAQSDFSVHLSP